MSTNNIAFQQALVRAKAEHRDWWNYSWIPDNEVCTQLIGLSIFFRKDIESGGLLPYDQGGYIPSRDTWQEIVQAVERFYACHSPDIIDDNNWRGLALQYLPRKHPRPKPARPQLGYVYLLKGEGYYKIGLSKCVYRRWRQISPKLPFEIEIVCMIATNDMHKLEASLHKRLADKRANGEWFMLDEADVEYIKGLARD